MRPACPKCGEKTIPQIPAKYSPEDPYGKYRREAKKDMLKEKGIL
jgi:H/ACA ribonucleoprotein complex subunit 3